MKIGFDAKRALNNRTGLGNYSRRLVTALSNHFPEHDYHLYTPYADAQFTETFPAHLPIHFPEFKMTPSLWRSFLISSDLKRDKVELYHGLSNELPLNIHLHNSIKKVVTIHDLIFLKQGEQYPRIDRNIYGLKTKYACSRADAIIACSNETKEDIMRFYKTPEARIKVVYQSCDPLFFERASDGAKLRVRHAFHLPPKYILNVASFNPRKNQLSLIRAFEMIKDSIEDKLVLAGEIGSSSAAVAAYIKEQKLENDVLVLNQVETAQLPALYQQASVFVYPSFMEGFGIPVLEAMASRVPVITTRGGSLEEVGGTHCTYVDTASAEELSASMQLCIQQEKTAQQPGFAHASTMNDRRFAEETMKVYLG